MDFNLNTYFNTFDVDKDYELELTHISNKLESITELLANNPESVTQNDELLEDLIDLTQGYKLLNSKQQKQLIYLITSSYNTIGHSMINQVQAQDFLEYVDSYKNVLEKYGYLIFVLLKYLSKEDFSIIGNSRSQKTVPRDVITKWNSNCIEVENALTSILTILKIDLNKVFITTPERNAFLELFSRPIINLMESPERMKLQPIRIMIFKILSLAVTQHGHGAMIQHSIIQCLTYYAHLPQYMAALLHTITDKYDYKALAEEVLREISQTHFNSNDTNGPKAISEFLIKLSELSPRLVLRQMTSISQLLDNSNQTLRCSVVETCGNIVVDVLKQSNTASEDEETHNHDQQVDKLLDLLEERFLDQNPYVRTKAIQAMTKVVDLKMKLTKRRQNITTLAVKYLDDKSTLVRRNSIKLLSKLIVNHQFRTLHDGLLNIKNWEENLDEAEKDLLQSLPVVESQIKEIVNAKRDTEEDESNQNSMDIDEDGGLKNVEEDADVDMNEPIEEPESDKNGHLATSLQTPDLPDRSDLIRKQLTAQYYRDAVEFIESIEHGTEIVSRLLFSKNRNEAIDSMDFLVLADAYGIANAPVGIRKMLHLVWMKGSSDEGKSVASHLLDCYKSLYLIAPNSYSNVEKATFIAKNLITLTYDASVADIASLEKLLGLMYTGHYINSEIINILWQIYSLNPDENQLMDKEKFIKQRRGSIIILGMLALEDNTIVLDKIDMLLKIGLGDMGKTDLNLCGYTCIALQRVVPTKKKSIINSAYSLSGRESQIMDKLKSILVDFVDDPEWYTVAEQAISAIYQSCSNPEKTCSDIIKAKAIAVFENDSNSQSKGLSQLLFIVGHVAIKMIVYLEELEGQFKKKKHAAESTSQKADPTGDNELEMIGGTTEDDFADAVVHVKDRELLYGQNSLLSRFGPLVREICLKPETYSDINLQRSAVLCMVKLMCISSIYCEENLPLLLKIMEKHQDPIIRCNCVLGLGDMAVCFNNIVDENTDFIYRRLTDESIMVQRTCLMTVTFLILAGQVKVKGQLSSMAKCLENPDRGISDMCKLFFAELATKDNAIYNGFIDIFSGLSTDESLSKDEMKRIIKFLIGFIDKEKHQKQLSEKLMVRLSKCQSEQQWNDVAFVLSTIPFKNENISTALENGYKMVASKD